MLRANLTRASAVGIPLRLCASARGNLHSEDGGALLLTFTLFAERLPFRREAEIIGVVRPLGKVEPFPFGLGGGLEEKHSMEQEIAPGLYRRREHVMECGEDHRHGFGRWKRPSWTENMVRTTKGGSAANQGGIPCRTPRRKARIIS